MAPSINWKLDLGDQGVLAPGRWLWARSILWTLLLFVVALAAFFACFDLSGWLKLPPGSDYFVAIFLPIFTIILYAVAVRTVEKRPVTEFALRKAPSN